MDGDEDIVDGIDAEVIKEARAMGWRPEEEFKGDKAKWIPADEFVEKGQHVLPILQQNNKRLNNELLTRDKKIGTLQEQLNGAVDAIAKLEEHYTAANKRAVEDTKRNLITALKKAREDDDTDAEVAILDQLDATRQAEKDIVATPPVKKAAPDKPESDVTPDFKAWHAENEWFGVDKKRTKQFNRIAEDLRDDGETVQGAEFFALVEEKWEEEFGEAASKQPASKVAGSNHSRNSKSSSAKTFANLPSEAKKACWDDVETFVGPNKLCKTKADWEARYAKIYYSSEG